MKKYFILMLLMMIPFMVYADNRVINGNDFDIYKRSKDDIANKWTIGEIDDSVPIFISEPSYVSPYKAGVVTDEYLAEVVDNLNYYRYLVGVPEILEGTTNDPSLQTAEVVQTLYANEYHALNHKLYNVFPKPDDMDQDFYDLGVYADHNIISYGRPDEPIFYFFDESIFNPDDPKNGHRMALLSPEITKEDYGIGELTIYGRNSYDIDNYNRMDNDFAAYPSPGYFPKQDFADLSDWDIYLNINKFNRLNTEQLKNVKVTFKNLRTGEVEERTYDDNTIEYENLCNSVTCLYIRFSILQPSKDDTYYEDEYEVTVENLLDNNNELVDLKYNVKFYDRLEGIESNVSNAEYDAFLDIVWYDGEFNKNLLDSALEDIGINIELESGYETRFVPNGFSYLNQSVYYGRNAYQATPDLTGLQNFIKDENNILKNKYIKVYGNENSSLYNFTYDKTSYISNKGDNVALTINGLNTIYDGQVLFMWVKENNGEFTLLEDANKYIISSDGLTLGITNLTRKDSGNYYLTALLTSDVYYSVYYLSKPISLIVNGDILLGDMNQNDKIDLSDIIILLKKYLSGDATSQELELGDMNGDGNLGLSDIITLLKVYLSA